MSYTGHSLGDVLPFCRDIVGVLYSPVDWADEEKLCITHEKNAIIEEYEIFWKL